MVSPPPPPPYAVLTGTACSLRCPFTSSIPTSLLWKMPAARAASTRVARNTSLKCDGTPAPELAMTGMVAA